MSASGVRCSSPVSSIAVEESAAVPDATIGVFSNSRSSHGNGKRLNKRQRTMGMNAKFDRMVNSLNVHEHNISHGSAVHRKKRSRSESIASTADSVHSRNISDAYSDSGRNAKIGATFGLVRKKTPSAQASNRHPLSIPETAGILNTATQEPEKGLPSWLSNTFSTLDPDNPLRFLIPKEHVRTPQQSSCPDNQDQPLHEDQIFAFEHSPAPSISSRSALRSLDDPNPINDSSSRKEPMTDTLYAPFSTPGPCYNSSLAGTAGVSPVLAASNSPHPRTPKGSSSPIHLGFVPFSEPGPASTISTHSPSKSLISLFHPVELSPRPEVDFMGPAVTRISSTPLRHSKISFAGNNTPSSDFIQTENTDMFDPVFNSYSDELPDLDHCEDPLTDDSGSDPFYDAANTSHTAIELSETIDIFKTPGPTYYTTQPIYFDSPTEEAVGSDPGYKIDYGDLDFSWTPYFRDKDGNSPDLKRMGLPELVLEGEYGETYGALLTERRAIEHLESKEDESTKEIDLSEAPTAQKPLLADANGRLGMLR